MTYSRVLFLFLSVLGLTACLGEPGPDENPRLTFESLEDIPFTDSDFRSCVLSQGVTFVRDLQTLDCNNFYITQDLNGIEYLTSLKKFVSLERGFVGEHLVLNEPSSLQSIEINARNLKSLNVRGLPELRLLRTVSSKNVPVFDFKQNTKIEVIDVQGGEVYIPENNHIVQFTVNDPKGHIPLTMMPHLEHLSVSNCLGVELSTLSVNNRIESVHTHNCEPLELLLFDDDKKAQGKGLLYPERVTELSLESMREGFNLTGYTSLQSVTLHGRNLHSINISNPEKVKYLDLKDGDFSHFDFSRFTALEQYVGLSERVSLFDFRNSPNLQSIEILYLAVDDILLSDHPNLERLYVYNLGADHLDLSGSPSVKELTVNWADSDQFVLTLAPSSALEVLRLWGGMQVNNLDSAEYLRSADIRAFGKEVLEAQILTLPNSEHLTSFICEGCGSVVAELGGATQLETLDLSDNALTSIDLSGNPNLKSVNLQRNDLKDVYIEENPLLHSLDLSINGGLSCASVARLESTESLTYFLRDNNNVLNCGIYPLFADRNFARCVEDSQESEESLDLLVDLHCSSGFDSIEDLGLLLNLQELSLSCKNKSIVPLFDFTAQAELRKLRVVSCNGQDGMLLKNRESLEELSLVYTQLPELDLSAYRSLNKLILRQSEIDQLILPRSEELLEIDIMVDGAIKSLDLRGIPNLHTLTLNLPLGTEILVSENQTLPDNALIQGRIIYQ